MATTTGKLLTLNERELCEKIAALKVVPASPRAQVLLLLDDGHTQAKSCELSSLTLGQLRYLLRLFKQKGMNLFPDNLFPPEKIKEVTISSPAEPEVSGKNPIKNVKTQKKKLKKKKNKKSSDKKKKKSKKAEKKKGLKSKVKKKKKNKKKK